jgi:hypothetical protein
VIALEDSLTTGYFLKALPGLAGKTWLAIRLGSVEVSLAQFGSLVARFKLSCITLMLNVGLTWLT